MLINISKIVKHFEQSIIKLFFIYSKIDQFGIKSSQSTKKPDFVIKRQFLQIKKKYQIRRRTKKTIKPEFL